MGDTTSDPFVSQTARRRTQLPYRYTALLPLALLAPFSATIVVSQAWSACEVPLKTRLTVFYLHFPTLVLAYITVLLVAYLFAGPAGWPHSLVVVISVLLVMTVTWTYFALAGLPLQNEFCPDVEPSWWPWLLPPLPGAAP